MYRPGSNGMCYPTCKPKWRKGRGSFVGYMILLCSEHQIIHKMRKIEPKEDKK